MPPHKARKPKRRAPSGPVIFEVPEVLAMMQRGFWLADHLSACRYTALTVLLGCCHILPGFAAGILLANWRPVDKKGNRRDVVIIWRFGQWQTVPLTPTVIFLVEQYIAERARVAKENGWTSEFLFVSKHGRKLSKEEIGLAFCRLTKLIDAKASVSRMLKNFCVRNLQKGGDEVASRRFRGMGKPLGDNNNFLPAVSEPKIAQLVRRTDPFREMARQVEDEDAAVRWLADRKKDLKVPLRDSIRWKAMPTDHPVVAAILRYVWPRGERDRQVLRAEIWRLHGADLDRLLRERVLTRPLLARLLHTKKHNVHNFVQIHFRGGRSLGIRLFKRRKTKVRKPRTKEDVATLSAIAKIALPTDPAQRIAAIVARVERYLPAVETMISRKVLSCEQAAALFGLDKTGMRAVLIGLKEGIPALRLLRSERNEVPAAWWKRIDAAYAGQSDADEEHLVFCCRIIKAGFPGSLRRLCEHVAGLARRPAPEMDEAERALVAALSAMAWSKDRKAARAQRAEVLRTHLAAVDALITDGKIAFVRAAALLDVCTNRFFYLRSGLRAGLTVAEVLAAPAPVPEHVWRAVEREHALAPDEATLSFFWRMRAHHGFTGGVLLLTTFRENLRLREAASMPPPDASAAAA